MSSNELTVTWTDQDRINKFSSKSVSQAFLEEKLSEAKKFVAANNDALEELELVLDEEEPLPCRFGDIFIKMNIEAVKKQCARDIEVNEDRLSRLFKEVEGGKLQLNTLKSQLSSKFGDSIQLEYD